MPLILSRAGGYVLVCVNGCVLPDTTKGLRDLVLYTDYESAPAAHVPAPPLLRAMPDLAVQAVQQASRDLAGEKERSTMKRVPGWYAFQSTTPTATTEPAMIRSAPDWKPDPTHPPEQGIPMRVFVCQVCGYTESYAGRMFRVPTGTP